MGAVKLNKRTIDRLTVERASAVFWDGELPGSGYGSTPPGARCSSPRRARRAGCRSGGRWAATVTWDAQDARLKAAEMIDRIRRGRDPVAPLLP